MEQVYSLEKILRLNVTHFHDKDAELENIYLFRRPWKDDLSLQFEYVKVGSDAFQLRYTGIVDVEGNYQYVRK